MRDQNWHLRDHCATKIGNLHTIKVNNTTEPSIREPKLFFNVSNSSFLFTYPQFGFKSVSFVAVERLSPLIHPNTTTTDFLFRHNPKKGYEMPRNFAQLP